MEKILTRLLASYTLKLPTFIFDDMSILIINIGDWVDSAQDRDYWRSLENEVLNLRAP